MNQFQHLLQIVLVNFVISWKHMIRNNKYQPKVKQQFQQNTIINYRNALYQGQYNKQKEQRQGRGIVYQSNTHHFIACNKFNSNKICEQALFFHSHSRYHYGRWKNNQPHGVGLFRIGDILIITQYDQGKLIVGTNILFVFEKNCMGIIIQVQENNQWSIRSKCQIFCYEQMENMIKQCDFTDKEMVSPSLIKFLNSQFVSTSSNSFKLRLIQNQFYRYGFDNGLAIFFDDQNQIISVGFHNRNDLCDEVGIKYNSKELGSIIQEGIFDGVNTFVFEKEKKPICKIGQMYSRHHKSSINFKNQFVMDPSQSYFQYFQAIMKENLFKDMVNQLITHLSFQNDSYRLSNQTENDRRSQKYKKLQFEQELEVPKFKKIHKQPSKSQKITPFDEQSSIKVKFDDKDIDQQHSSFQKLSQKNRLQIMKKELYESIIPKQFPAKLHTDRSIKSLQSLKSNKQVKKEGEQNKVSQKLSDDNISEDKSQRSRKANLQQKIDIIIRQSPPQEKKQSKSRTKKKIFEMSKSIKRDYSPESQVSPFKSRMKSRIFDKSYEKSRSKSNKKIFSKMQKSGFSKSPLRPRPNDQYLSPHLQLGFSIEKSSSSSQIANFPVTMSKQTKYQLNKESEDIQDEGTVNLLTVKKSKTNLKENFKMKEDQHSQYKKGNQIYRNPMINGGYNQYVYEPISIKQSGNTPYIKNSSLKSLSRNKSNNNLQENSSVNAASSKKVIEESTPLKITKMSGYLNREDDFRQNSKYSDYKKRTGYF